MRGQTLVELLLAIGLAGIILPALLTGLVASRSGKAQQIQRLEAVALLKETEEAVRNFREKDWNTFAVNGTYYPTILGSSWVLTPCPCPTVNGFTRSVVISDVQRNASGVIVSSGGTVDPSSKKLVITVSWGMPLSTSIQSTIYLMRLDNITYAETTEAQFNNGTKTGITVTNTAGGEFVLSSGTAGSDWCQPADPNTLPSFDLPKSGVANAVTAITAPTGDTVFAGTGNNSSGVSFQKVNVNTSSPPIPSGGATFDGYKTNGVFGDSGYAYLATDNNSKEIVIIDLNQYSDPPTNSKYKEVGYFNAPGNGNGNSIYVVGNTGYMTSGNKFYTFSLSGDRSGSQSQLGSATLPDTGVKIMIVNSKAYVALDSTAPQLQIIDVSNPSSLPIPVNVSVTGKESKDVFINPSGTRAYLATETSASQREFFIINVDSTDPGYKQTLGSFDTSGMDPKGVTVVTNNKSIIVGSGGTEYQVIDISDELNPQSCGSLNIDTGVNGVAGVLQADGDAYSYIITGDANAELKIIPGGAGGAGGYVSDGTFESQTIPIPIPINNTSFNRFEVVVGKPSQTDIYFQVAVAQAVNNSCIGVTYNYVGTDGTSSTFFTTPFTNGPETFGYSIPPSINPGRCFRYKVYMSSSDSSQTPIFYDITINYAP